MIKLQIGNLQVYLKWILVHILGKFGYQIHAIQEIKQLAKRTYLFCRNIFSECFLWISCTLILHECICYFQNINFNERLQLNQMQVFLSFIFQFTSVSSLQFVLLLHQIRTKLLNGSFNLSFSSSSQSSNSFKLNNGKTLILYFAKRSPLLSKNENIDLVFITFWLPKHFFNAT